MTTATTATTTPRAALNWFEIPAQDLGRAIAFYETLLATRLQRQSMGDAELAVFAYDEPACGGCLMAGPNVPQPSCAGTLVYLNAEPSLDAVLARVAQAGGRIASPKVQLPGEMGCFAHVVDSEGNRVGLHALA